MTLLNSLILVVYLQDYIGLSTLMIISSTNETVLLPSFHWFSFIFCLITLARTSGAMLSRHPCLIPDLRGEGSSQIMLNMILVVGFSEMPFTRLERFPSIF